MSTTEVKRWMPALTLGATGDIFLGMVRVDGPPEWARGEGKYVLAADFELVENALTALKGAKEPKILDRFLAAPGNSQYITGDYGGYFRCTIDNGTHSILE